MATINIQRALEVDVALAPTFGTHANAAISPVDSTVTIQMPAAQMRTAFLIGSVDDTDLTDVAAEDLAFFSDYSNFIGAAGLSSYAGDWTASLSVNAGEGPGGHAGSVSKCGVRKLLSELLGGFDRADLLNNEAALVTAVDNVNVDAAFKTVIDAANNLNNDSTEADNIAKQMLDVCIATEANRVGNSAAFWGRSETKYGKTLYPVPLEAGDVVVFYLKIDETSSDNKGELGNGFGDMTDYRVAIRIELTA